MYPLENNQKKIRLRIKKMVFFFIISLLLSGVTARPIECQLQLAVDWIGERDPVILATD